MSSPAPSTAGTSAEAIGQALQEPDGVQMGDTGASILKPVDAFLTMMSTQHLGFLYQRWTNHPCADPGVCGEPLSGTQHEENTLLGQMKPMAFGAFDNSAKRLDALNQAAGALGTVASNINSSLSSAWSDSVGQQAAGKFNDLKTGATNLADTTSAMAAAMHALWTNTRKAVANIAAFPSGAGGNFVATYSITPGGGGSAPGGGNLLGWFDVGEQSAHLDMLNGALTGGGYYLTNNGFVEGPFPPQMLKNTPGILLGSYNHHDQYANDVCNEFNDFCSKYASTMKAFRALIDAANTTIMQQMDTLRSVIDSGAGGNGGPLNEDPFGALAPPAPAPAPSGSGGTSPSAAGGAALGGGMSAGGGGGMSGGGGSAGTSAASFTPPPLSPSTAGGAGAAGAAGAMPPSATTTPSSIPGMPGTGTDPLTGAATAPQGQPETVTVQNGSNQISMTSPDGQGTMKLTVDDGSGTPKTYDVNFGQGATGATGVPGTTAGAPGTDPSALGGSALGGTGTAQPGGLLGAAAQGAGAGFGPTGTADPTGAAGALGADGAQQITPGPDGNAVIHDGNLTITATEPAGHSGPVQVTVDDGSGHPTTYTMDPSGGAAAQQGAPTMQPLAGTDPSGAAAAPAHLDPSGAATPAYQAPTPQAPAAASYADPSAGLAAPAGGGYAAPSTGMSSSDYSSGFADPSAMAPPVSDATAPSAWLGADSAGGAGIASGPGGDVSGFSQSFGGAPMHSDLGGSVDHSGSADAGWPTQHDAGGPAGLATTDVSHAGAPGGAGLATGPGDVGGQTSQAGMPMMGGMGGAGGGVGGDIERGASQWRTQGHVFDDQSDNVTGWISGVLDDNSDQGQQGRQGQ
ncbi:MAG TPA: hypothetical protein VHX38_33620 [Pseudonocardiaceae bacterium]|jgi:hypothetical protein|nr:hypothetical protein [Pseudonocardiaceae bacterium]